MLNMTAILSRPLKIVASDSALLGRKKRKQAVKYLLFCLAFDI
jgi:hypothetical protein